MARQAIIKIWPPVGKNAIKIRLPPLLPESSEVTAAQSSPSYADLRILSGPQSPLTTQAARWGVVPMDKTVTNSKR